ncbi:hypothetical protein NDU88_006808, partial [Pleurodeles waltl]
PVGPKAQAAKKRTQFEKAELVLPVSYHAPLPSFMNLLLQPSGGGSQTTDDTGAKVKAMVIATEQLGTQEGVDLSKEIQEQEDKGGRDAQCLGAEIICEQETHIPWAKKDLLQIKGYSGAVSISQSITARGGDAISEENLVTPNWRLMDKYGRWAILGCQVAETRLIVRSIYGSNFDEIKVYEELTVVTNAFDSMWGFEYKLGMVVGPQKGI